MARNKLYFAAIIIIASAFIGSTVYAEDNPEPVKQEYAGVDKCKACHAEEYKMYQGFKYSKNFKIIEMRGESNNPKCLKCHTTGYNKGGFVSVEKTPEFVNVQCEACHGAALEHTKNPADKEIRNSLKIAHNVCLDCHTCMQTHQKMKE